MHIFCLSAEEKLKSPFLKWTCPALYWEECQFLGYLDEIVELGRSDDACALLTAKSVQNCSKSIIGLISFQVFRQKYMISTKTNKVYDIEGRKVM